jgi:hypothetical protein
LLCAALVRSSRDSQSSPYFSLTAGVYGIMSYMVSQRVQELGIRMTLRAQSHELQRHVLACGLTLVVSGLWLDWSTL